ncbi:MAG TPA: hypothetical protein VHB21_11100, partial [Minicystis sp.]|nr:hypothetical protein [Minicystis sp.]
EGRDDGHVWHLSHERGLSAGPTQDRFFTTVHPGRRVGAPRQTPMLVGRVAAKGPYGWRGQERSLEQRIEIGFAIHRWGGNADWFTVNGKHITRAEALAAFLRTGLAAPPVERRELTAVERRGRELFLGNDTGCAGCHAPASGYTDRSLVALRHLPAPAPFADDEPKAKFKTPSLLFVGKSAPYFHDGHAATLAALVAEDHDRMGLTDRLSPGDQAALVAYLATIGTVLDEPAEEPAAARAPGSRGPLADAELAPTFRDGSTFAADPPGAERSPKPTAAEWDAARPIDLPHESELCAVRRVREWARVACRTRPCSSAHAFVGEYPAQPLAEVTLVAGSKEDVDLSFEHPDYAGYRPTYGIGVVVFPVRRGDARLFEVDQLVDAHKAWVLYDGAVDVSESWPDGAPAPAIAVTSEPCPASR